MLFIRTLLASMLALSISAPVLADEVSNNSNEPQTLQVSSTDNGQATQVTTDTSNPANADVANNDAKVNLNQATAKDLAKLKGMNASKARAVIAYRKKHGEFKSVDELSNVKGFKKMKSEKLKEISDQLTI